jgi:O-acetyl-ADP-ribose deacetylase (regulator of RNase III)
MTMGAGIAVQFKRRYGNVDQLLAQQHVVGQVAVLERDEDPRVVYYLVTKEAYWHKPTLRALAASLVDMRNHAVAHGVTKIACPRIGCGLDRLSWPDVKATILKVFEGTGIEITVYSL